jgi:hypothetical protein
MSTKTFSSRKFFSIVFLLGIGLLFGLSYVPVVTAQPAQPPQVDFETVQPAVLRGDVAGLKLAGPPALPGNCNPSKGSGGLKPGIHSTTVAGLKAIVVVGKGYNPSTTTYLGFYLHGDGGLYTQIQKAGNPITQFANAQSWIIVSPLAPNGKAWWSNWKGNHVQALAGVFNAMFAKYNVCRSVIFGTGGSGGAEFWSSQFFPAQGGAYPAHMVLACGGSSPAKAAVAAIAKLPGVLGRTTFQFVSGTKDRLHAGVVKAHNTYKSVGFDSRLKELVGLGHCNTWYTQKQTTWPQWTVIYWKEMANKAGVALK